MTAPRLTRSSWPPARNHGARIVHIGTGNFSRSHQAWYTHNADPSGSWGIVALSGRGGEIAAALSEQDGLYTLIERGPAADRLTVIDTIVGARSGADIDAMRRAVCLPSVAVVTLTVTEAGYAPGSAALERLTRALASRRDLGLSPLALVSCDNLHANGEVLRDGVLALADRLDPGLPAWIERECAFVSTSVDRITPRTTDADRALVTDELEIRDAVPVVCEPFSDWVLSGDFPAGRPRWEDAGARFVADVQPWELRKLWLLNGAHSLLAYLGLLRGHATVADAIADPRLRGAVESFWNLAQRHLPDAAELDLSRYREQLLERFANARIGYPLTQIAGDGLAKLRNRVVPVIDAALSAGELVSAVTPALHVVSAWIVWLSTQDLSLDHTPRLDADIGEIRAAMAQAGGGDRTAALIELLAPAWNRNPELLATLAGLRDHPQQSTEESRP